MDGRHRSTPRSRSNPHRSSRRPRGKAVWLLAGVGVGLGLAAAAWWISRQRPEAFGGLGGLRPLSNEPTVRQHVVRRNEENLIESVETVTFPGSSVGGSHAMPEADVEVVHDE